MVRYCRAQIDAGAEAIQIFDSWAGVLDEPLFERWVIQPTEAIITAVRESHPHIPMIGFPRGAGVSYADYARKTRCNGVSIDQGVPVAWAAQTLQPNTAIQGNLDPARLLAGGAALTEGVDHIIETLSSGPFIFNLGHGVIKETPPEHVAALVARVRMER